MMFEMMSYVHAGALSEPVNVASPCLKTFSAETKKGGGRRGWRQTG